MKKESLIIVTGGAGFIGSAFIWYLNREGYSNIIIVDKLETDEKWKNLLSLKFKDYFEADDFANIIAQNPNHLGTPKLVVHLGACSSTTEKNVAYLIKNNFEYTKNICHWALKHQARFVTASSAATYGDGTRGMEDDNEQQLHHFRPLNAYGFSKHLFDLYAYKNNLLPHIVCLKYFNIFGANENHKGDMRSLVNKAFHQIQETNKLKLFKSHRKEYKDGKQMRDFLYIKDAVKMTAHLAFAPQHSGIFNIGSSEANTWFSLANEIFKALGKKPNIEFIPMPKEIRSAYQYHTEANIKKLRTSGYQQKHTPLATAIDDYIKNYLLPAKHLGDK